MNRPFIQILIISLLCACTLSAFAQQNTSGRCLFRSYGKDNRSYRIPAIVQTKSGDLIAVSDDRICNNDVGYGHVDLVCRVSGDNGDTWFDEAILADGDGVDDSPTCGFGDAAIVADRETDRLMVMCVSAPKGGTCWTSAQRSTIIYGTVESNGTISWTTPHDIKDDIMKLLPSDRINYFVGSGKLHQSRYVKVGDFYRVYAALWTTSGSDLKNYVIYTDDFGASWHLLGTVDVCPGPDGNEPKCEELPNGDVLLSARQPYHRLINIYHYTDAIKGEGHWDKSAQGIHNNDGPNGTNGEILVVEAHRRSDDAKVWLGLQSAPNDGRANLTVWYKDLGMSGETSKYTTPEILGQDWTLGKQITSFSSAYSTMCIQNDSHIGFFYEDGKSGASYDMMYLSLTIQELTGGKYY